MRRVDWSPLPGLHDQPGHVATWPHQTQGKTSRMAAHSFLQRDDSALSFRN
jgi:hypothetical protein